MRRTAKTYKRLEKRLQQLFRQEPDKQRFREAVKLMDLLNHPGWTRHESTGSTYFTERP